MRVNVISGILLIPTCIAFGQVGISKNSDQIPTLPPYTSLYLDGNQKEGSSLGVILPHVTKEENLPLYNASSDPSMEGMVMYNSQYGSVNTYDGSKWVDNKNIDFADPTAKQSRFLGKGNGDDEQSVVCVLLVCGRDQILSFSHPIDNAESYNNLNITRQNTSFKYGGITYTDKNSKFVITEAGTYQIQVNIPTYIAGVVSLTEGASYQLYAFKKNSSGNFEEILLASAIPNFPGILGIGGGSKSGVGIITTIALNPGDYVYAMIHSPSVTVSVGSELRSWDNGNPNPREIIFTKLD